MLVVRDDGNGIEPADRARVFERFERLASHEGVAGTGLGLPIARDLARRMGGDLDVASVPASGLGLRARPAGPGAGVAATVAEALELALSAEEQSLEERAVLRALAASTVPDTSGRSRGFAGRSLPRTDRSRRPQPAVSVDG